MRSMTRNRQGVKDSADCWRTINGEPYVAWLRCPSAERIQAYRDAGLRVRRFGEELFVHDDDKKACGAVDEQHDA